MRTLLAIILIFPVIASASSTGFSPDSTYRIDYDETRDPDDPHMRGTEFSIKDRSGKVVYSDTLTASVSDAVWTKDGKFIIMPTSDKATAGQSKTPWRYSVYIISIVDHKWHWFRGAERTPFISAEVWTQAPDIIILVGHTFQNDIEPPDDPVLLRYKVSELWKQTE